MLPLVIRSGSGILGSDDIKTRKVVELMMAMAMTKTTIFRWRVLISGGLGAFLLLSVFEAVAR